MFKNTTYIYKDYILPQRPARTLPPEWDSTFYPREEPPASLCCHHRHHAPRLRRHPIHTRCKWINGKV